MRSQREYHFDLETPFKDYPQEVKDVLLHGTVAEKSKPAYKGAERRRCSGMWHLKDHQNVGRRYVRHLRNMKAEYRDIYDDHPFDECRGQRLKQESLAVTVADKNIAEMCDRQEMVSFFRDDGIE